MNHLYIHIPFCKSKCSYCDFVSFSGKENLIDNYVEALTLSLRDIPLPEGEGISTLYFGGGTPTLLKPAHYKKILSNVKCLMSNVKMEVTIEANPKTADFEKLKAFRQQGINRLSIGAQSFHNHHLKILGRIHEREDIIEMFKNARAAGFANIGLDLIYALPDQTIDEWKQDLAEVLKLNPEHISIYNLQIEEATPLWEMTNDKFQMTNKSPNLKIPNEDEEVEMFEYAIEKLKDNGYRHYEISNFAKPGFECRHNLAYWENKDYLGIGAGAHSHANGFRWANTGSIEEYIASPPPPKKEPALMCEKIIMGLRLLDGIAKENFAGYKKEVEELKMDGLIEEDEKNIKLTRRGLLLGNLVFQKFV